MKNKDHQLLPHATSLLSFKLNRREQILVILLISGTYKYINAVIVCLLLENTILNDVSSNRDFM